jgi:hypothetical protein
MSTGQPAELRVDDQREPADHSSMDLWEERSSRCDGNRKTQRCGLLPSATTAGLLLVLLVGCGLTESLDGYGGGTHSPEDAGVDQGNAGSGGDAATSDSGGSAGDSSVEDSPDDAPVDGNDDTSEPEDAADATQDVLEDAPLDVSEDAPETGPDATVDSSTCLSTQKLCNGQCVEVTDPAYGCGLTGCTPCPTPAHATATCQGTTCLGTCQAGWADCNTSMIDGCEINTNSNALHCGGCGQACSTNRVTPTCVNGNCTGTCASGYGDCNNNLRTDGCEVNLNSDTAHCGACARACSIYRVKSGGLSCALGLCNTNDCNAAWSNVTMPPAPEPDDGCETPI